MGADNTFGETNFNPDMMTNYDRALELRNANDFSLRSCWECNPAHEHLKTVGGLFTCIDCGRWFMNGGFFESEEHCNQLFVEREPIKTITFTSKKA